jgi:hypothetical protein
LGEKGKEQDPDANASREGELFFTPKGRGEKEVATLSHKGRGEEKC